jgi:hypothetical protein
MKLIALITALAVGLTAGFTGVASASHGADDPPGDDDAPATASLHEFEGRVVSINREAKRFRLNDAERGIVRIRVTRATRFERIDGFAGLRVGMRAVEASVRRGDGI